MIVSGADADPKFQDMLNVCERYAKAHYPFVRCTFHTRRPNLEKVGAMIDALENNPWVLWMDADSMLFQPIPEVVMGDHDIAFCTKEPGLKSRRYGNLYYSGFVFAKQTEAAMDFLHGWEASLPGNKSDQQALHHCMTQPYKARIQLLDPSVYVAQAPIHEMRAPNSNEKVIHFKGALQKRWIDYKDSFLESAWCCEC